MKLNFELGEVSIVSTNLDRSLEFYRDILGFEAIEKEGGAVRLKGAGHVFLVLPFAKENVVSEAYCDKALISFDLYLDNVEAAYNFLVSKKVRIEKELNESRDCFYIRDPDGLVIEIMKKGS